jgi:hypothetical protein
MLRPDGFVEVPDFGLTERAWAPNHRPIKMKMPARSASTVVRAVSEGRDYTRAQGRMPIGRGSRLDAYEVVAAQVVTILGLGPAP